VQVQLGLYVLGGLSPGESAAVEKHLEECAGCRAESAKLYQVPAFLSLLTPEQVRSLSDNFPPTREEEDPASTSGMPWSEAQPSRPPVRVGSRSSVTNQMPPSRGGRHGRASGSMRSRRRTALWLAMTATALVLGVGIGLRLASDTPTVIELAGTETDTVTGVSMSVTVVGSDVSSHVSTTIKGLRPGVEYKLIAVESSGRTQVIAHWFAEDRPYAYAGDVSVRGDRFAFLSVTQMDGAVVITVKVAKSRQGARPAPTTRPLP
jgi:hypothetical protein